MMRNILVGKRRTPIGDAECAALTEAFQVLGAERVALGLKATGHMWGDCFLSFALSGAPFGFRPALERGWRTRPTPHLTIDQTNTIVRVWDRKEAAFRWFAAEWLGTRRLHTAGTAVSRSLHEPAGTLSVSRLAAEVR